MSTRRGRNYPESVRVRLRQLRSPGEDSHRLWQRYVAERFLFRLGASPVADHFVLKGASLFFVWGGSVYRHTKDVDLLAEKAPTQDAIRRALDVVCEMPCPEDGVVFDPSRTRVRRLPITEGRATRFGVEGRLGKTRLPLQVDVGVGDSVNPPPILETYPTLLGHPQPVVWVYPRETVVAEKFSAMVTLGQANSRVKDIWDIAALATNFTFDGSRLQRALRETLAPRDVLAKSEVEALGSDYYDDPVRRELWSRFRSQADVHGYDPSNLAEPWAVARAFLTPVWNSIVQDRPFARIWPPGGSWQSPSGGSDRE